MAIIDIRASAYTAVIIFLLCAIGCGSKPADPNANKQAKSTSTPDNTASSVANTASEFGTATSAIKPGTYTLTNFSKCLDLSSDPIEGSRKLQLFGCGPSGKGNQSFNFKEDPEMKSYIIKSDGEYIQVFAGQEQDGARIESVNKLEPGRDFQRWTIDDAGGNDQYTIKSKKTGKCIRTSDNSGGDKVTIIQKTCDGSNTEKWKFVRQPD